MNDTNDTTRSTATTPLRLTSFSHGGGCGCKIAPGVLGEILKKGGGGLIPPELMVGIETAELPGVHALTDVTGFGLAGHTLELARGAGLAAVIEWARVPLLAGVAGLAAEGVVTGASGRNWAGYGADVTLAAGLPKVAQDLLSDPQTSGGLLVSCDPDSADEVLRIFHAAGFGAAAQIGRVKAGPAGLRIEA